MSYCQELCVYTEDYGEAKALTELLEAAGCHAMRHMGLCPGGAMLCAILWRDLSAGRSYAWYVCSRREYFSPRVVSRGMGGLQADAPATPQQLRGGARMCAIGVTADAQELADAVATLRSAGRWGVMQYCRPGLVAYHGWLDLASWTPGDGNCVPMGTLMSQLLPNSY